MPATRRALLARSLPALAALALPVLPGPARADAVDEALAALIFGGAFARGAALEQLAGHTDPDIAPALILALRYARGGARPIAARLRAITGHDADDWFGWMLWQEAHPEIVPRAGYGALKRRLYLAIDPAFAVFLRPEHLAPETMRIRFEEAAWGGVRKDGIPALDGPEMIAAEAAGYLLDDDLVFGIEINGDIRAYPLRIMGWHEMFNDVIGGVPVALAYCTLCGAGILFETRVEGRAAPFVFGSSGFLYRSNKLMFDRETHSLWNQFTGEPVIGPLAASGIRLAQRPVAIARWADWRAANPGTTVLSENTGHVRDYGSGVVYRDYFASPDLMFPTSAGDGRLAAKAHVFGIRSFGAAKAWPLDAFAGGRVINDRVGDLAVVLVGDAAGRTVRAYDRGGREFSPGAAPDRLLAGGAAWEVTEAALVGPGGARAPRVAGHVSYWFAWDGYLGATSELFPE
ncbi:hypothetical protein LNKW23_38680 [Paralimibaculum aggregatum]|uniref:DUF3179 domain-containing protein n=1 Tax=Paralimibaculum aggregatum TaxID=3036245 RepID=A0ABQ6LR09_9RHOB|nr:DUF3179 domain-containing protein [Limibaculum sp. NKW23]GMG84652.1 hypothetical protein LNKW23_38680 [Limibaculum sp. NKW23]